MLTLLSSESYELYTALGAHRQYPSITLRESNSLKTPRRSCFPRTITATFQITNPASKSKHLFSCQQPHPCTWLHILDMPSRMMSLRGPGTNAWRLDMGPFHACSPGDVRAAANMTGDDTLCVSRPCKKSVSCRYRWQVSFVSLSLLPSRKHPSGERSCNSFVMTMLQDLDGTVITVVTHSSLTGCAV